MSRNYQSLSGRETEFSNASEEELHRAAAHRMASAGSVHFPFPASGPELITSNIEEPQRHSGGGSGLGIFGRPMSFSHVLGSQRSPIDSSQIVSPQSPSPPHFGDFGASRASPGTPQTEPPGSSGPFLSPRFQSTYNGDAIHTLREEDDISRAKSVVSYEEGDVHEFENRGTRIPMNNDNDNNGILEGCPSDHDIHSSRLSWISVSILFLSIYSTIFSAIWLVVAIVKPRYNTTISSHGKLTPSTASTLFALFAKTIELSFVTVFVTFLGQVLTRRSLAKESRGVTIAELSMRTWVIQPGFMITHWKHLKHASLSILGVITLTAAVVSMFYTTASDSLVAPHLKYGRPEDKLMQGLVQASFANPKWVQGECKTPISSNEDPLYAGETCANIEHAGQAYQNMLAYLATWQGYSTGMGAPTDLKSRPPPQGIVIDSAAAISVNGSWIETNSSDVDAAYLKYKRVINNVTMAMPHAGVITAAKDKVNKILQPEDLAGVGEYNLKASVVSPVINVLCVNMNKTELDPLVYVSWPNALTQESSNLPGQRVPAPGGNATAEFVAKPYLNSTVVDDIFQWGPTYNRLPPVFPMSPIDHNSVLNISVESSDSNYLLIKSADTTDYTVCQLRAWLTPNCSTEYKVSGASGGILRSNCEDPDDSRQYRHSVEDVPAFVLAPDYRNVGSQLLLSLSLNTGVNNANASSGRLLSQLALSNPSGQAKYTLNPLKPSLAETLAVLSGSSLLSSVKDAPFVHYWDSPNTILDPGVLAPFNASLASQQYTSGPTAEWEKMFYVILALVFTTNVFCLVYFFVTSGLVTDFTEVQNLFALAVNSPPSRRLAGSCGAGPEGDQLNVDWHVGHEEGNSHFFIKEGGNGVGGELRERRIKPGLAPVNTMRSYGKLSNKGRTWL